MQLHAAKIASIWSAMLRLMVAPLLAAALTPAAALPVYGGFANSTNGLAFILRNGSSAPFTASNDGCANNACISTGINAGPGGVGASYAQGGSGNFISAGGGKASAFMQGDVTVIAPAPGGPAFVDTDLRLQLSGRTTVEADSPGVLASGGVGVLVAGPLRLGSQAYMRESHGANVTVAPDEYVGLGRTPLGELVVPLRIVPGVAFTLSLHIEAFGGASGIGGSSSVQSDWLSTLSFATSGPVFTLPAGYSASSVDFFIDNNAFCPNGCLAVPEPGSGALLALGLVALAVLVGRRKVLPRPASELHWEKTTATMLTLGRATSQAPVQTLRDAGLMLATPSAIR